MSRPQLVLTPFLPTRGGVAEVALDDLLCGAVQLAAHLRRAVATEQWQDAFLFAAGLTQMVEDRLHSDTGSMRRAAAFLGSERSAASRVGSLGAAGAATLLTAGHRRTRRHRRLLDVRAALVRLVGRLADIVIDPVRAAAARSPLRRLVDESLAAATLLDDDVVRLPACFRSFDQHPDDVRWLAEAFVARFPSTSGPVCAVGVRTSGSYLAPLHSAALRASGIRDTQFLTHRPHHGFLPVERNRLRRVAQDGGRVLITDDPPGSGSSLAATARAVERVGVPSGAIVIVVSSFPDTEWPLPALSRWACVIQPWSEWSVHRRLAEPAVATALGTMLDDEVDDVRRADPSPVDARRGHVRAQFEVRTTGSPHGNRSPHSVCVEGAGLGYLGRHALAVATALPDLTPRVIGFADGLLFSHSPPSATEPPADATTAAAIADYAVRRHEALPARRDPTATMRGRDPVWEAGAALLAGMFGALGPLARPLLLEPLVRRLLAVDRPSVVDGDTGVRSWRRDPADGHLVKLNSHGRAFSHLELACYDPLFDLAGAAADPPEPTFERELREQWQRLTGVDVDPERWLVHRLTHLWRMGRAGDIDPGTVDSRSATAVTEYLAGHFLSGLVIADGPLCAIDLDGVLESDPLGFPAPSPTGVMSLRALITHGYRPVVVTGRGIADVRNRCTALGLVGGVAEYGAAIYDHAAATVLDLRTEAQRELIGHLRADLGARADIDVDTGHEYTVRARSQGGQLGAAQLAGVLHTMAPGVRVVAGMGQTDLVPAGLDKAVGLRALLGSFDGASCALAVGDTEADLSMLALARIARAPRNADAAVRRAGVTITPGRYQSGLADAVGVLLGHRVGRCVVCRPPVLSPRTNAVLRVLELRDNGLAGLPVRTARLALSTTRLMAGRHS